MILLWSRAAEKACGGGSTSGIKLWDLVWNLVPDCDLYTMGWKQSLRAPGAGLCVEGVVVETGLHGGLNHLLFF